MHPILTNRSWFLLYLRTACIPIGVLLFLVFYSSAHLSWRENLALTVPLTLVIAFLCLSPWYLCEHLPLASTPPWKVLANHLGAALVLSAMVGYFSRWLSFVISHYHPGLDTKFRPAIPLFTGMLLLFYLLSVAIHYVFQAVESSRQAVILSREAQLKALKAQVNPHFLFNSLHSISALTAIDPKKAREMCISLSEFLRASLRLGDRSGIPFGEELSLTKSYLDVEQVRFGNRLVVTQNFDPGCDDIEVPPLLVQPLVENAIKHGIATLVEGGEIAMSGRRAGNIMQFTIENPFDPESPSSTKNGFGLINIRRRLEARYGNAARMEVQVEQNRYRVSMWLPCGTPSKEEVQQG